MIETDKSLYGTGQFRLHYTSTGDAAQAMLGPSYTFGNEAKITVNPESEQVEIKRHLRGINRKVSKPVASMKLSYDLEVSQLTFNALARVLFVNGQSFSEFTRSAGTGTAASALDFRTSQGKALVQDRWYDISALEVRGLHLTSVALTGAQSAYGANADATGLLEGKDYELDRTMGSVRFLRAVDDIINVTSTYPAITASDPQYSWVVTPNANPKLSGIGVVEVFNDDRKLIYKHEGFGCVVVPNGDLEFNSQLATVKLKILPTLPTGNILAHAA